MGKSVRFGSATSPNQVRSMRFGPPSVELSPPPSPSSTTKPSRRALSSTSSYRRASTPNRYGLDDSDSEGENEQGHQQRASTSKSVHNDDKLDKGEGSKDDISEFRLPLSRSASSNARLIQTREEQWEQQEFYQGVRLRQRADPVEEYEERTKREAWHRAHEKSNAAWAPIAALLASTNQLAEQRIREVRRQQVEEVRTILEQFTIACARRPNEEQSRANMDAANKKLWEKIDQSIKETEVANRKVKEDQEEKARMLKEAEEAKLRRVREEEEARAKRAAQELVEKRQREESESRKASEAAEKSRIDEQQRAKKAQERKNAPKSREEEYEAYHQIREKIKMEIMPAVKKTKRRPDIEPNPAWSKEFSKARRKMNMKVGQVTNDPKEIEQIAQIILNELAPTVHHPPELYRALLYALAKIFVSQAETEVTAKPSTAFPLARLVTQLVCMGHPDFGEVLLAKLVQATGGWVLGMVVPMQQGQTENEYRKALGYRSTETTITYVDRMAGLLTLYTAILQTTLPPPILPKLPSAFHLSHLWTWIARILSDPPLLQDRAAPQLIAAVLETGGDRASEVWGKQIAKIRVALGKKCFEKGAGDVIGGKEGNAGRVRLGLVLEKWEKEGRINPAGRHFGM